MEDISDTTNITGLASLLDYDGTDDLDTLEKSIIENKEDVEREPVQKSEVDRFKEHLTKLSSMLGQPDMEAVSFEDHEDSDDELETTMPSETSFMEYTEDKKNQSVLSDVMKDMDHSNNAFQIEAEIESDEKCMMLEDIDTLMTNMQDMGVDLSRIPAVDNKSSMDEIKAVHKILRIKNDKTRYCDLAEDTILGVAHLAEIVFDGKKRYLGKRPDLTGWHNTVNIKLRRMRFNTSTFVSNIMRQYDISHGARILLELIPSIFTHTQIRTRQNVLEGSSKMNDAMNTIRNIDEACD